MALLCTLTGCTKDLGGPAPSLWGRWAQEDRSAAFYQVAVIDGDMIETYWFLKDSSERYLYWSGTFDPPTKNLSSYSWQSVANKKRIAQSPWGISDETVTFTYKDGKLIYTVHIGHLNIGVSLRPVNSFLPEDDFIDN